MRWSRLFLVVLVAVLAACGGEDAPVATDDSRNEGDAAGGDGAAGTDAARPTIEGDYVAVEVLEDGEPRDLVDGTEITMRLDGGTLAASAGCNSIGGDYTIAGAVLVVDPLSMTEMGCEAPRHDQDQWLADFLISRPQLSPVEEGFLLANDSTSIDFRDHSFVRPDLDLVGTEWNVTGFLEGETATSMTIEQPATLTLTPDGSVELYDGCNGLAGTYELGDGTVRISDGGGTASVCEDSDAYQRAVRRLFGETWQYDIDGDVLTLLHEDGAGVTFRASGA